MVTQDEIVESKVIAELYSMFTIGNRSLDADYPVLRIQPGKVPGTLAFTVDGWGPLVGGTPELYKLLTSAVFQDHPTFKTVFAEERVSPSLWWESTVDRYRADLIENLREKYQKTLWVSEASQDDADTFFDPFAARYSANVRKVVEGVQSRILPTFAVTEIREGTLHLRLGKNYVTPSFSTQGTLSVPFDAKRLAEKCRYSSVDRCIVHALVVFYNMAVKKGRRIEDFDGLFYRAAIKVPDSLRADLDNLGNAAYMEGFLRSLRGVPVREAGVSLDLPEQKDFDEALEDAFANL